MKARWMCFADIVYGKGRAVKSDNRVLPSLWMRELSWGKIHYATVGGYLFQRVKHFIAQDGRNWIFFSIFAVWFEDWRLGVDY